MINVDGHSWTIKKMNVDDHSWTMMINVDGHSWINKDDKCRWS